ncbi:hypothetical protein F5Y15DRAFT_48286 [Xylariaceae sp. FL0016]|nr:hypothetical protein F5Y15DRAFT_48286 [Xylariaceae sp. FL0016]
MNQCSYLRSLWPLMMLPRAASHSSLAFPWDISSTSCPLMAYKCLQPAKRRYHATFPRVLCTRTCLPPTIFASARSHFPLNNM